MPLSLLLLQPLDHLKLLSVLPLSRRHRPARTTAEVHLPGKFPAEGRLRECPGIEEHLPPELDRLCSWKAGHTAFRDQQIRPGTEQSTESACSRKPFNESLPGHCEVLQ